MNVTKILYFFETTNKMVQIINFTIMRIKLFKIVFGIDLLLIGHGTTVISLSKFTFENGIGSGPNNKTKQMLS